MLDLVNFQDLVNKTGTTEILAALKDYPKYRSVGALAISGLPVPKSIIVFSDTPKSHNNFERLIRHWNVDKVVVRSDKKGGKIDAPSVQNCRVQDAWQYSVDFLNKKLLPMVISTGDIFHNVYSVNIKIDPTVVSEIYLEIVGPGFCATDLNKRDIVHERGVLTGRSGRFSFYDSSIVSQKVYNLQISLMKDNLIKKEENKRGSKFLNKNEANSWVNQFLVEVDALILKYPKYVPVSSLYLISVWKYLENMIQAGKFMGYNKTSFIVSMSFVTEKETVIPYFWDIHPYGGYNLLAK